jgi:hypothetical protein
MSKAVKRARGRGRSPALRCGVVSAPLIATETGYGARVLLDAELLASLGLAKPLMIAVFSVTKPSCPGF